MKTKDKGGRPALAPDDRSRQMVEVLSGFGIPQDKIADVIGVDGKTLRKHYATELQRGAATVEAKLVGNLLKLAGGSDGTALKAIMFALQCRFGWSLYAIGRQWGWLSVNTILRRENENEIGPKGDEYLTPLNMVPAGEDPMKDDPQRPNKSARTSSHWMPSDVVWAAPRFASFNPSQLNGHGAHDRGHHDDDHGAAADAGDADDQQ